MTVPDQRHINQVSEALWRLPGEGASVMIGSGFSRNARGVRPGSKPLPMLVGIARELYASLYPDGGDAEKIPQERILRLAQAYEAEFGPTALHEALKQMVRDNDVKPGRIHERLLRLPWADVFTTNWDTLLERASKTVRDRTYTIVRSKDDIPWGPRPRIVKLHGTLPNRPLVLTEEDYRTYPTQFSPFVNTVQQAMMETIFVLIGFSGNDPNFLHWSGWVRDNLDKAAPKICLAGFLKLSRPERRMLQDRNVIAIDLAQHPGANRWPEHLQHVYAAEWILSTLECGQPYDKSRWPSPRAKAFCSEDNPLLQPIVRNVSAEPRTEPWGPPRQVAKEARLATAKATLRIWRHNRECYPSWLVAPVRVRNELRGSTERWVPFIVPELPGLGALERLEVIREIIWRHELTLARIPDDLEVAAEAVLESIDCAKRTVEGDRPEGVEWEVIRTAWREVALTLLTAARYRRDHGAFNKRLDALEFLLGDDVEVAHRVCHERCLWDLWSLDHATLGERLDAWKTDDGDVAWAIRKSALLREIGRKEEANRLIELALDEIRAVPEGDRDLGGLSREGWALWSLVETFAGDYERLEARWNNVQARWDELAAVKCDPSSDVRHVSDELSVNRRETQPPAFDLGARLTETRVASRSSRSAVACRGIRLTEISGVPPSIDVGTIAGGLVKRAAEALVFEEAALGIRQMIRVTKSESDKAFMRVLSRPRVASLSPANAKALAEDVQIALKEAVSWVQTGGGRRLYGTWRASVTIESLSRLVLRLDAPTALSVFDLALDLYKDAAIMPWFVLHRAIRNLLRRCWESLDDERRAERVLDVLEMPIVGLDGYASAGDQWPDPSEILSEDLSPPMRSEDNEDRWRVVISTLVRGLGTEGQVRERAAVRIANIAVWGRLAKTETGSIAEALWGVVADEEQGLPDGTPLRDYAFILLPEPTAGMGRDRFARKWLSGDAAKVRATSFLAGQTIGGQVVHTDATKADDILWQVGMSIAFVRRHERTLDLTDQEKGYLFAVIERWSETKVAKASAIPEYFVGVLKQSVWDACRGLRWILTEIQIPSGLAERLCEQVPKLIDSGIPAYGILPGIGNVCEDLREDIALLMSTGLASEERKMGESAMWSLHCWMRFASDPALGFVAPPAAPDKGDWSCHRH